MHKPIPNVLPLDDPPRQKSCLRAVADIIRHIKAANGLTNIELAEQIGVSSETVSNAENENNLLNLVTFLRIWFEFGEDVMAPTQNCGISTNLRTGLPNLCAFGSVCVPPGCTSVHGRAA